MILFLGGIETGSIYVLFHVICVVHPSNSLLSASNFINFMYKAGVACFDQHLGAVHFKRWLKFAFSHFSHIKLLSYIFCAKNMLKAYFDHHLECAAPKHWSKYTKTD